jgi:hypothetical protein
MPDKIEAETPMLLDNSGTPRATSKKITLERNFSMKKWLYNKNISENFDPDRTATEIKRSKKLRIITRRQEKQKKDF